MCQACPGLVILLPELPQLESEVCITKLSLVLFVVAVYLVVFFCFVFCCFDMMESFPQLK